MEHFQRFFRSLITIFLKLAGRRFKLVKSTWIDIYGRLAFQLVSLFASIANRIWSLQPRVWCKLPIHVKFCSFFPVFTRSIILCSLSWNIVHWDRSYSNHLTHQRIWQWYTLCWYHVWLLQTRSCFSWYVICCNASFWTFCWRFEFLNFLIWKLKW